MSVLIKEMKFPKNCEDCPLGEESDSLYYSCYPQGLDYTHDSKSGRMPNCPLVEVPPHGRLIDGDALKQKKKHSNEFAENVVSVAEIDWMPTILEAEGEE